MYEITNIVKNLKNLLFTFTTLLTNKNAHTPKTAIVESKATPTAPLTSCVTMYDNTPNVNPSNKQ